jgi:hypothetical protein
VEKSLQHDNLENKPGKPRELPYALPPKQRANPLSTENQNKNITIPSRATIPK